MCWYLDSEDAGYCVGFCMGSEANPTCADPMTSCHFSESQPMALCLLVCDPLTQDCPPSRACYATSSSFSCLIDASGDAGAYGDACEYLNACDPGLFCAIPEAVPGCGDALGCCTPFCDVDDPNATTGCPGFAGGQECVPWFEEGQAPSGWENLGLCMVPL